MDDTSHQIFKDCVEGLVHNVFKVCPLFVISCHDVEEFFLCRCVGDHRTHPNAWKLHMHVFNKVLLCLLFVSSAEEGGKQFDAVHSILSMFPLGISSSSLHAAWITNWTLRESYSYLDAGLQRDSPGLWADRVW
jgi:hypothetical protein